MGQMAPAGKDRVMSDKKLDELARMSGLPENAAYEAAEAELDRARDNAADLKDDPFDSGSEEMKAQRKDERRKDIIHTESKDYDAQDEGHQVVEEEDEDEGQLEEDPVKLRRMLQNERKSKRRLVKKLSIVERGAALGMAESAGQVKEAPAPAREVQSGDLLAELGIEDPEEPLSASKMVELFGKMNARQMQNMQAETSRAKRMNDFQSRAVAGERAMKQEVEDYDEVVTPEAMGRLNPKSPNYDAGMSDFLRTRSNPAKAYYEMLTQQGGRVEPDGEEDLSDEDDDGEEVDERTLAALRKRNKKQESLTMNRTPKIGRGKRRNRSRLAETLGVFEQIQSMDDEALDKYTEKFGGEPYR